MYGVSDSMETMMVRLAVASSIRREQSEPLKRSRAQLGREGNVGQARA